MRTKLLEHGALDVRGCLAVELNESSPSSVRQFVRPSVPLGTVDAIIVRRDKSSAKIIRVIIHCHRHQIICISWRARARSCQLTSILILILDPKSALLFNDTIIERYLLSR